MNTRHSSDCALTLLDVYHQVAALFRVVISAGSPKDIDTSRMTFSFYEAYDHYAAMQKQLGQEFSKTESYAWDYLVTHHHQSISPDIDKLGTALSYVEKVNHVAQQRVLPLYKPDIAIDPATQVVYINGHMIIFRKYGHNKFLRMLINQRQGIPEKKAYNLLAATHDADTEDKEFYDALRYMNKVIAKATNIQKPFIVQVIAEAGGMVHINPDLR